MGDCIETPAELSDFASKDTSRITGVIAKALAANSPLINVLNGGTFASGLSDEVRSIVQMPAAPGDSLAAPTFVNDTDVCGTTGEEDLTGTVEFTYRLQSKRGKGPRICVKKGYSAFQDSYTRAEDSLSKLITQYINADIKYQVFRHSASKFLCLAGYTFDSLFTGGTENDVDQPFLDTLPNAQLSFAALHRVARHLREVLLAETYAAGSAGGQHFRFIGGNEVIEAFRSESGVKDVLISLVTGKYDMGKVALTGYSWDVAPAYRGIGFGIDQRPLRYNVIGADGFPDLINPVTIVTSPATNTAYSVPNQAWLSAAYEIGFLFAANSFERQVPERYVGEGSFRFAPQLHAGELQWHYQMDNDCNSWGDFGWHKYQITRAYKPLRPQHVVPIAYKRCEADLGLFTCTTTGTVYTGEIL
jgi:hypothetical protein